MPLVQVAEVAVLQNVVAETNGPEMLPCPYLFAQACCLVSRISKLTYSLSDSAVLAAGC